MMRKNIPKDDGVLLEKKAFVWIKTAYSLNGTWAKVSLTERGVLVKDRILGLKSVDFPYSSIISVKRDADIITIRFTYRGKKCWVRIKVKGGGEDLEYLLARRISSHTITEE